MDYTNHNTTLRTNKHLNLAERFYIERRLSIGDTITAIATSLGRSRTTIHKEIKRGTVVQIKQNRARLMYIADTAQINYEKSRQGSFNVPKINKIEPFISWIEEQIQTKSWSLDAAVGYAINKGLFTRDEIVCTKTLYNYLHEGLLSVLPIDMPLIPRRSTRKKHTREHKVKLGKSIDLRDESVLTREEFGHWEIDTVRGVKDKNDQVLVTVVERKTRLYTALLCPSAKASDVKATIGEWLNSFLRYSDELKGICKSITADNGREFAELETLENDSLLIFFAHPYSSWERGSNERHNGLLRRFIPKGKPISEISESTLQRAVRWCNNLPRKILGYNTPQEAFLEEVSKIKDLQTVQFDVAI